MESHIVIRRATLADADAIADVHVRAWRWAYRGQLPTDYLDSLSVADRAQVWRTSLDEPSDFPVWVAEATNRIVAFASAGRSRDNDARAGTGEVYAIYIDEDRLGTGLGRNLLRTATEWLKSEGYASITLWVLDTNGLARRFYEAAGWSPDGSTKEEPRAGFTLREVRYRRSFEAPRPSKGAE